LKKEIKEKARGSGFKRGRNKKQKDKKTLKEHYGN